MLAKFNASNIDELFMHLIGSKKEKENLLLEVLKMNDLIKTHELNFSIIDKYAIEL